MILVILLLIFGILAALFAVQNTAHVAVSLFGYTLSDVPVYLIMFVSLLAGILVSSIFNISNIISSSLTIHGKNAKIKKSKGTMDDQDKYIRKLELENAKLKGRDEKNEERTPFTNTA
jgi:uncharacterized integral membrane protein